MRERAVVAEQRRERKTSLLQRGEGHHSDAIARIAPRWGRVVAATLPAIVSEGSIRITLVRHGESVANRTQRWQGQGDSELSELGRSQAQALATRIGARPFDLVVASDLMRASDTARALERPFERARSFREFDIGSWEGLTREQVVERFGDELARLDAGEDVALGGGESYASFCQRIDAAFARLRARLIPGQHALVVCHGGVIGALVSGVLGLRGTRELPIGRALNTSITELRYDPDGSATVQVFNDSLHLAKLSLFPHPVEMASALALVCGGEPHATYGAFAAHYDFDQHGRELVPDSVAELRFPALLASVRARHPECRVSLAASAERIHEWTTGALWRDSRAARPRLSVPRSGALCHVGSLADRLVLLDYGVSV